MCAILDELAAENAIFACDVGTPTIWAARYLTMNGKRRLLGSFLHGSMANALPQAIGAQASLSRPPGCDVVGRRRAGDADGRAAFAPAIAIAGKGDRLQDDALAFVELEMKASGLLEFTTDLQNPNFAKIAEAAGLLGLSAELPEQVRPMISQALEHKGPALVEVVVHRQELAMPPTITL